MCVLDQHPLPLSYSPGLVFLRLGSPYVAQTGLKLTTVLSPDSMDHRCVLQRAKEIYRSVRGVGGSTAAYNRADLC